MLTGNADPYSTPEGVRALYDAIGAPTKELVMFESWHALPAQHGPKVVEWFLQHLKVQDSKVT